MRIPLAIGVESRDGQNDPRDDSSGRPRDGRIVNGIAEVKGEGVVHIRKRPGMVSLGTIRSGNGQLIHNWNGVRAIVDDYIHSGTVSTIVSAPSATSLTPTNADLLFSAANTGSGAATPRMMFKNRSQAWTMNRAGTVSAVTYGGTMGSETYAVASLTRSGTTATATIAADVPFQAGESVTIAGAVETAYNGSQTVTAVTPGTVIPARDIPITITRTSTTATATTVSGPHGLSTGTYTISGANQSEYNGAKSITVTSNTTFTFTVTVTPAGTMTWNPSDKASDITLSGGNLTATVGSSATARCAVRSTVSKTSGKWYWEVTIGAIGSEYVAVGIAKTGASLAEYPGGDANGWGYWSTGFKANNASVSGSLPYGDSFTTGDVIGVALDLDSGTVKFYKNGASQGEAFTGISGTLLAALGGYASAAATVNFGGSAFAHTIPSGFAALNSDSPVTPGSGTIIVTDPAVNTPASFTFTVGGSPSTPATGTITAQGQGGTVPGIGYLNGYFVVMDTSGTIWNSASDDPTSWGALDFLVAQNDSSRGMGLAVSNGYLCAFKEWSTEFFYDAGNATGSPFSPVDSRALQIGCASGWSIASIDDMTFWLSQTKVKGRGVHVLTGLESRKVSTPDIDRILDDDALTNVYGFCLKIEGHALYILTLAPTLAAGDASGITLAFDATTGLWYEWSAAISGAGEGAPLDTVDSITRSGNTATVVTQNTFPVSDGAWVVISGASQSEYNGLKQCRAISTTSFSFKVYGNPLTPATTASAIYATYTVPRRWPFVGAISFAGTVLMLHESTGKLYALDDALFTDDGNGIDFIIRTPKLDLGTMERKKMPNITIVGTRVPDWAMVRWSDDDYATASAYRPIYLDSEDPQVRRCGSFRRRSIEIRHTGNSSPIFEALESEITR